MHPKILDLDSWDKLREKFSVTLKIWNNLDGLKKIYLMKTSGIDLTPFSPSFGIFSGVQYPKDIFLFSKSKNRPLSLRTLSFLRSKAKTEGKEVGGIINDGEYKLLFIGDTNRIDLNVENIQNVETEKNIGNAKENINQTLFHTHIEEEGVEMDPPSVLDIVNFVSLVIKYVADYIIKMEEKDEKDKKDDMSTILKIKNNIIFTKNEIYVYYVSTQLMKEISKKIMSYLDSEDFIYEVEKVMEHVELSYSNYLEKYNTHLDFNILSRYIEDLLKLGIIVRRYTYEDYKSIEVFS